VRLDDVQWGGSNSERTRDADLVAATSRHASLGHSLPRIWSRRQFLQAAAGASTAGLALGIGLLRTESVEAAPGIGQVLPIPGGLELFGQQFHVFAPPIAEGPDSDPASVTNFQGAAAIAFISGSVTRTNRKTGEARELPFLFNDMRFMQGVFRGRDGHVRDGTFAFI